jgi:hypothetical protein
MHDPPPEAWDVLLNVISYSYHSRFKCITYRAKPTNIPAEFDGTDDQWKAFRNSFLFHGYVDGSWKIPSVSGFAVLVFDAPIDWSTKLIKVICHSAAETEISAGSLLCKKLTYCRQLCADLGIKIDGPIPVFIDNSAALDITGKLGVSKRTAHFLRWQHYLRWMVQHHYVRLIFVVSKRQLADALTKIVDRTMFFIFRDHMLCGPFTK